ncbi:MAG: hypothetical protein LBD81_01335, partial [Holosporaceae bacterium]|nr:hypothetical protein [Holosporaceae bacterium]
MKYLSSKIASIKKRLKSSSGYVLILTTMFLPVLFFGIKYAVDLSKVRSFSMERQKKEEQRTVACGREAALAAARIWNPGLTLTDQKMHVLKAADDIYNRFAAMDSVIAGAIPGMDIKQFDHKETSNLLMKYMSIFYNAISRVDDSKPIKYEEKIKNMYKIIVTVPLKLNVHAVLYLLVEALAKQNYLFHLEGNDVLSDISVFNGNQFSFVCSGVYDTLITNTCSNIDSSITDINTSDVGSYSYFNKKDSDTNKINLSLSSGNITVKSDNSNEGMAVPATCNVDIILALPVNGAACSASNGDYTTSPIGSIYTTQARSGTSSLNTSSNVSAPICEISRSYRKFLKNNFFYTRGTNVGIIPYSSKISIPSTRTGWTKNATAFSATNISTDNCIYGKDLYSTSGEKDAALVQTSYIWGEDGTYPIMHRYIGTSSKSTLLSTTNPTGENCFVKMNLNPCYMGYANTLGMKCEKNCTKFQPNPYPIVELTADVRAAYEILGSYFPFYDTKNASNFIFLPLEWAKNLLNENWSHDPTTSGSNSTVQQQSKTTGGRKKAVIIVVNKPDWFEPGELTYLGFDNDAAALPMHESDKINFAIDYATDHTKKFLDGTTYDGKISGSKKILTFSSPDLTRIEGYYETNGNSVKTGTLYFPEKGTVILRVARATGSPSGWQKVTHNLNTWGHDNYSGFAHGNSLYVSVGVNGDVATSQNMTAWTLNVANLGLFSSSYWQNVVYGGADSNKKFLALNNSGYTAYSTNGTTWSSGGIIVDSIDKTKALGANSTAMCFGHGIFLVLAGTSIAYSSNGLSWTVKTGAIPINATWRGVTAVNSSKKFVAISSSGIVITVTDPASNNWVENISGSTSLSNIASYNWGGLSYGGGKLIAVSYSAKAAYCPDENGTSWEDQSTGLSSIHYGEWYGTFFENNTFYAHTSNVYLAKNELTTNTDVSAIKFTNLKSGQYKDKGDIKIDEETTFIINSQDISDTKENGKYCVKLNMKMIKLISAEISNQTVEYVPPSVSNLSFNNCDTINFKVGETSGEVLSYTTTAGQTSYKNGYGLQCGDHSSFEGTFTTSKSGTLYVIVDKNDSVPITTNVADGLDLTKWHAASSLPSSGSWQTRNIAYNGSKFYAVSHNGYVAYSSDGKAWASSGAKLQSSYGEWRGMSYGGGKLVAVNWGGYIAYSSNGVNWTVADGPKSKRSSYWYGGTAYGNNKFIMTNGDAYVAYSSDGASSWSFKQPLVNINSLGWDGAATCGKHNGIDRFLAICYYGQIGVSPDGVTWTSLGGFGSSGHYFGLCYGDDKFVATNGSGSVFYSINGGTTWTIVGSPLASISNSTWSAIGYGNNMFVAVASNGSAAYCNEALVSAKTITPIFKFGDTQFTNNSSTMKINSLSGSTTKKMDNVRLVWASLKYQDTAKGVHNIIDFSLLTSNTKNNCCTLTFSGSTSIANDFRIVSGTNTSGFLQISNTKYGIKSLSITVAPLDNSTMTDGKLKLTAENNGKYISDTSERQIKSKETIYINPKDLTVTQGDDDNVTYKINLLMTKIKLISAQVVLDNRTVSKYPSFSWRKNARLVNWSKNPPENDSDIAITSNSSNYTSYNSENNLHSISSSSCHPTIYPETYVGDCTFISQEYSTTTPFVLNLIAPSRVISGYYAPGIVRIFSESATRDAANKLDINTATSNSAYLVATEFTYPVNHLLAAVGYQTSTTNNSKIIATGSDSISALKKLTKKAADDLKNGNNNIRVYIIKYRCPTQYRTYKLGSSS